MSSPLETIREKNSRTTAKPPGQSSACPPGLFDGSDLLADGGSKLAASAPDCADVGRPVPPARAARAKSNGADDQGLAGPGRTSPLTVAPTAAPADPLPGVPAVVCPACGCPAVWMDGLPVVPVLPPGSSQADVDAAIAAHNALPPDERVAAAGRLLAAHLHCGGCRPPPAMSLARRWFLVVVRDGGDAVRGDVVRGGAVQSLWEEWRPVFNLSKRKLKH